MYRLLTDDGLVWNLSKTFDCTVAETAVIRSERCSFPTFSGARRTAFQQLIRSVSIGKLKTYQLYERVKMRFHMTKLNSETLRKAAPRLWARIAERDEEFATDVAQTILVSHLDMIKDVLDLLGIPHEDGFSPRIWMPDKLTEGWQQRVYETFKTKYPEALLVFYINHLDWELTKSGRQVFQSPWLLVTALIRTNA